MVKLGTKSIARQKEYSGGKITQQVGVKPTQASIQRQQVSKAEQERRKRENERIAAENKRAEEEYLAEKVAVERQQKVINTINQRLKSQSYAEGTPSWMNKAEAKQYQQAMDSASSSSAYYETSQSTPGRYDLLPEGEIYFKGGAEGTFTSIAPTTIKPEMVSVKYESTKPDYVSTGPLGDYIDISKPGGFEAAVKEYGVSSTEVKRYEDLGYTSKESMVLARESERVGGMSFTPEYSESLLPQKEKSFAEKTIEFGKEKYEGGGVIAGVSTSFVPSKIGIGFPGTEEQSKRIITEPKEELKRVARGTGLGVSFGSGSMLLGSAIYNIPTAMELGKETVYSSKRQKELTIATEQFNIQQQKWTDPLTGEFTGTEEQFGILETQKKDIDILKGELVTRKATKKELAIQFGTSMAGAALFGGAFTGAGMGLKKGGMWAVSKTPAWLGKGMTYAGTGIEKGTQFYFTSKFMGEGIDIVGSLKRNEWELAKLRTAELGGGITGYTIGARGSTKGIEKGVDLWKYRKLKELPLAEWGTKPFWKPTEGKYVFMKRYEGFKLFQPSSYKPTIKGTKKGQFLGRQWKRIPFEVEASMKGKSEVSAWKIDHKTKKISWTTEKATAFPFDKPSTHLKWFQKYGYREYGLPGTPKQLKGKPFGYSATGEAWKGTEFEVKPFKYKGGEIDMGAYQYYSGKGVSGYFYRLGGRKYPISFKGSLFGDVGTPTTYAGYFESIKKGKGGREVKGKQDGRELKAYLFKEKMKPGEGVIPGMKQEVELTTTFTERKPFAEKYYQKIFGRKVPIIEQTFGTEGSSISSNLPKIKDTGSGISSLPEYPTTRVYLFGGVSSSSYTPQVSISSIPIVSSKKSIIKESKISSSIIKPSYKPISYKPTSYKPSSYKPSSYKPSSYKPTSYKPSLYKPSSYKSSRISEPPYYPTSRITTPPRKTPTKFPSFPQLGGRRELKFPFERKKRKISRRPSLWAAGEKITAYKIGKSEASGLGIRPIIIEKPKKKRRKKK